MKVFVLAPNENWVCDRIAREWKEAAPDICANNIHDADIIWLLAGWCWNQIDSEVLKRKKVIVTEHHIVPSKFDEKKSVIFKARDALVDAYHVPNNKTAKFIRGLTQKPIHVLPYWYNANLWFPENKEECRNLLKLPLDRFIIGSFQRDTEGGTRNPKLEKGPDLFVEYLKNIKRSDLLVLLGGWRREYVCDELTKAGIPFTGIELAPLDMLRKMYAACDLYVVSSRYEGGPQAIYEASSMRVPIISRDVGVADKILSPSCIVDIPHEIYYPTTTDIDLNFKNVQAYNINNHKRNYIEMLEKVLK